MAFYTFLPKYLVYNNNILPKVKTIGDGSTLNYLWDNYYSNYKIINQDYYIGGKTNYDIKIKNPFLSIYSPITDFIKSYDADWYDITGKVIDNSFSKNNFVHTVDLSTYSTIYYNILTTGSSTISGGTNSYGGGSSYTFGRKMPRYCSFSIYVEVSGHGSNSADATCYASGSISVNTTVLTSFSISTSSSASATRYLTLNFSWNGDGWDITYSGSASGSLSISGDCWLYLKGGCSFHTASGGYTYSASAGCDCRMDLFSNITYVKP